MALRGRPLRFCRCEVTQGSVLVTGGTGRLARNWALAMASDVAVTLADRVRTETELPVQHAVMTLDDRRALTRQLLDLRPELVVNAAGLTDVETCESEPEAAHIANVVTAGNLAEVCAFLEIPLVQISTDHLFDGPGPTFDEAADPAPVNTYARTKAEAERVVLERHPAALIVRTNFFGLDSPGRPTMSGWILKTLEAGQAVRLFDDVYFSPVLAQNLAREVHGLVAAGASGIVNVASADRLSKFDFGVLLAEVFGLDPGLLIRASIEERADLVMRPRQMALSSHLSAQLLGRPARTVREHLLDLKAQHDAGLADVTARNRTPYGRHRIEEEDIAAVSRQLRSGSLTQGPRIDEFERELARHVEAEYAVAVSSGTAALHLAAIAADLGPGRRLMTSPITFVATANAARYTGADVTFVDVEPDTVNLSPAALRAAIDAASGDVGAVTAVHLAGLSADMRAISAVAAGLGATVIEDAAHALGGNDADGHPVGSCRHSDMTVFSLHPVKSIAAGEGGVITTNDPALYRRLIRLRSHGINKAGDGLLDAQDPVTGDRDMPWRYEMQELGHNLRFTDIQAALALAQLRRLDAFVARRRELAERYDELFGDHPFLTPLHQPFRDRSAHHLYVVDIDFEKIDISRGALMQDLRADGFVTQVHYMPVPAHPYYRATGHTLDEIPNAVNYYRVALSIPLFVDLFEREADRFASKLLSLLGNGDRRDGSTAQTQNFTELAVD